MLKRKREDTSNNEEPAAKKPRVDKIYEKIGALGELGFSIYNSMINNIAEFILSNDEKSALIEAQNLLFYVDEELKRVAKHDQFFGGEIKSEEQVELKEFHTRLIDLLKLLKPLDDNDLEITLDTSEEDIAIKLKAQPAPPAPAANNSALQEHGDYLINMNYEYEDRDINGLLKIYFNKFNVNCEIAPIVQSNASNYGLKDILEQFNHSNKNNLAIPYNISGGHWIGIFIQKSTQGLFAIIMDPLDKPHAFRFYPNNQIKQDICSILKDAFVISKVYYSQSQEQTKRACGPLTIMNLFAAANNMQAAAQQTSLDNIREIRHQHIYLAEQSTQKELKNFYARQLQNSAHQMTYFNQASTAKNNQNEINGIFGLLKKIPLKNRKRLLILIKEEITNQHNAHLIYLDNIYNCLKDTIITCQEAEEKNNLESLCQLLYQRSSTTVLAEQRGKLYVEVESLKQAAEKFNHDGSTKIDIFSLGNDSEPNDSSTQDDILSPKNDSEPPNNTETVVEESVTSIILIDDEYRRYCLN